MTAAEYVRQRYPAAFAWFDPDKGTFKVYSDRTTFTAISASCASDPEAWQNASEAIKEREARTTTGKE
jgi:hypothetical protein